MRRAARCASAGPPRTFPASEPEAAEMVEGPHPLDESLRPPRSLGGEPAPGKPRDLPRRRCVHQDVNTARTILPYNLCNSHLLVTAGSCTAQTCKSSTREGRQDQAFQ